MSADMKLIPIIAALASVGTLPGAAAEQEQQVIVATQMPESVEEHTLLYVVLAEHDGHILSIYESASLCRAFYEIVYSYDAAGKLLTAQVHTAQAIEDTDEYTHRELTLRPGDTLQRTPGSPPEDIDALAESARRTVCSTLQARQKEQNAALTQE